MNYWEFLLILSLQRLLSHLPHLYSVPLALNAAIAMRDLNANPSGDESIPVLLKSSPQTFTGKWPSCTLPTAPIAEPTTIPTHGPILGLTILAASGSNVMLPTSEYQNMVCGLSKGLGGCKSMHLFGSRLDGPTLQHGSMTTPWASPSSQTTSLNTCFLSTLPEDSLLLTISTPTSHSLPIQLLQCLHHKYGSL